MLFSDIVPFSYEKSMRERAIELMQDARLIDGYIKYVQPNPLCDSWQWGENAQVCLDQQRQAVNSYCGSDLSGRNFGSAGTYC